MQSGIVNQKSDMLGGDLQSSLESLFGGFALTCVYQGAGKVVLRGQVVGPQGSRRGEGLRRFFCLFSLMEQ